MNAGNAAKTFGMRSVDVRVKGPGAGRESAIRALQTVGHRGEVDPRRHADSAQRLPAAEAAARVGQKRIRTSVSRAVRRDDCRSSPARLRDPRMARYIGPVCRLCRREGMKLFLKGERCYTEKCAIEKRNFPPGQHGKVAQGEAGRLRPAAAREAEGQAHLRRARGPVPPLLRGGRAPARHHRRDAAAAARAAARQRRLPPRPRDLARRRRASSCATATSR